MPRRHSPHGRRRSSRGSRSRSRSRSRHSSRRSSRSRSRSREGYAYSSFALQLYAIHVADVAEIFIGIMFIYAGVSLSKFSPWGKVRVLDALAHTLKSKSYVRLYKVLPYFLIALGLMIGEKVLKSRGNLGLLAVIVFSYGFLWA